MNTPTLKDLSEKQRQVVDVLQRSVISDAASQTAERRNLRETGATLTNAIDKLATLEGLGCDGDTA